MNRFEITTDMLTSVMLCAQNPRLDNSVPSRGGGAKQTADDTERAGLRRKMSNKLRPQMKCFFLYDYTKICICKSFSCDVYLFTPPPLLKRFTCA